MEMKVLVIDDDKMVVEAIMHQLTGMGMEVDTATNGFEALDRVENKRPDLIISDIMMPGMNGLSLLSILKQFYFDKVPVIVISSLDKADLILSSLGLGAEDFITKPINFEKLTQTVRKYIK